MKKNDLADLLINRIPMQKKMIRKSFDGLDDKKNEFFEKYLTYLFNLGLSLDEIADGYCFLCKETQREQIDFFRNHNKYKNNRNYIVKNIYGNAEYMKLYMLGLAISTFIWPQHIELFDYYIDFIGIDNNTDCSYCEIGPGNGLYAAYAFSTKKFTDGVFIDVSSTGIENTKSILSKFSDDICQEYHNIDFIEYETDHCFDVVCAAEVIEAVESPFDFIKKCLAIINSYGRIFLSTPLNAPEVDCIFKFSGLDEIENLIESAGGKIISRKVITYNGLPIEKCISLGLPVNVAFVLKKERK